MEPILEVEESPELVSGLFDKQVLDYRQPELQAAELRAGQGCGARRRR